MRKIFVFIKNLFFSDLPDFFFSHDMLSIQTSLGASGNPSNETIQ